MPNIIQTFKFWASGFASNRKQFSSTIRTETKNPRPKTDHNLENWLWYMKYVIFVFLMVTIDRCEQIFSHEIKHWMTKGIRPSFSRPGWSRRSSATRRRPIGVRITVRQRRTNVVLRKPTLIDFEPTFERKCRKR